MFRLMAKSGTKIDSLAQQHKSIKAPQYEWLVRTQFKALELAKSDWTTIRKSPPWALDSWGLGCLIYELFSNTKLMKTGDLRNTSHIPKTLLPDYQKLLGSVPSKRLNSAKLIENSGAKQALISLSDKRDVEMLAKGLTNLGYKLVSTGVTASALEKAGYTVIRVEELTSFPEMEALRGKVFSRMDSARGIWYLPCVPK